MCNPKNVTKKILSVFFLKLLHPSEIVTPQWVTHNCSAFELFVWHLNKFAYFGLKKNVGLMEMGNDMEMDDVSDVPILAKGNKEACRRYYARNSKASKRRVLMHEHEISHFGRVSKEATLKKWDIDVHDVIDAFRKYREFCPPEDYANKLTMFRVLISNILRWKL